MMTQQELFSKNLILSTEFDRYVLEHPELMDTNQGKDVLMKHPRRFHADPAL